MNKIFRLIGWGLSYVRAVVLIPVFLIHTLICSIYVIVCALIFRNRHLNHWNSKYLWSYPIIFLSGIKLEIRGGEGVNKGSLFLFNHASHMDIPILFFSAPCAFTFGAKIELFSIPFFGSAMRVMKALPIARDNREEVLEIYRQAETRVKEGECFALAPEGTRQEKLELGAFKSGPFIFAHNANIPMVPILIAGLQGVMSKKSYLIGKGRWRHKVIVQVCEPIDPKKMDPDNIKEYREDLRQRLNEIYQKMNEEVLNEQILK